MQQTVMDDIISSAAAAKAVCQ